METRASSRSRLLRIGLVLLIALLVLATIFLLGPRVPVDPTVRPVELPADLDAYLVASEARFDDIVPGTEKRIVWAGQPGQQTDWAVVHLHGFSATRQETAPLAEELAAALGANLYEARLTGHGRSGPAMAEATVNDWLNDTYEALAIGRRLGNKVVVFGTSTGGTLVAWLAAQPDTDGLAAAVMISPNFTPADSSSELLTWPWGAQIARLVVGPERSWQGQNADHELYWTNRYPTEALLPMMGLVKLVRDLDFSAVNVPALIIYSPQDDVVNPQRTEQVFQQWGAAQKQILPVEGSDDAGNHVLAGDILSPSTTGLVKDTILGFLAAEATK